MGNQNARKEPAPKTGIKNKFKQVLEFEKQTQAKQAESVVGSDIESDNSCSGEQLTTITVNVQGILESSKTVGFSMDAKKIKEIINSGIDPSWLDGSFNFLEYAAQRVKTDYLYKDKPPQEQKRIFVAALKWPDLQEEFQKWRETRQREADRKVVADAKRHHLEQARAKIPKTCAHCGAALGSYQEWGICRECNYNYFFNEDSGAYEFEEKIDFSEMLKKFNIKKTAG